MIKLPNPEGLKLEDFHRSHLEDALKSLVPDSYSTVQYNMVADIVESFDRETLEEVFSYSFTID